MTIIEQRFKERFEDAFNENAKEDGNINSFDKDGLWYSLLSSFYKYSKEILLDFNNWINKEKYIKGESGVHFYKDDVESPVIHIGNLFELYQKNEIWKNK